MSGADRPLEAGPVWFDAIARTPALAGMLEHLARGRSVSARGLAGSSGTLLAAVLSRRLDRPLLLVAAHLDDASDIADELADLGIDGRLFPALEVLPGDQVIHLAIAFHDPVDREQ